ncbi:trypsin-like peptidase domain-containing protein [Streptomyces sp. NBC_01530]|uniref:S1C family serine protease n=1 Tax=Streptomyces sp. NBC_01530 TaxID=2903895 RepID=UPI00386F653E
MNEGKPTKPKWWNRPRLQDPAGQAEGAAPAPRPGEVGPPDAEYISDGDFELARPDGVDSGRVTASGGDYELGRPDTGKGTAVSDGAPAVDRPDGVVTESAASAEGAGTRRSADAGHGQGTLPEGDFELRAPRAPEDVARGQADSGTAVGSAAEAAGGPVSGSKTAVSGAPRADGDFELDRPAATASVTQLDPAQASAPTGERPRPLHDPDPYSTPPYGEPGPWAPAPPVQHPAATTAQGTTAIPAPAAHHGAAIPTAPAPHGTLPQVPATAQGATPTPVSGTSAPAEVPHASPAEAPVAAPEPGMPAPGAPSSFAGPSPQSPAAASSPPPSQPSSTPWQNYDPWAPAPLQQNGAVVESKDKRRRRLKRALVGGAVALALVSGGVGGVIGTYLERNGGVGAVELPQAGKEPAGRAPDSVAGIAARALPSVVTLHVTGAEESGTGTGIVLDDLGHILTNNHVVEPAAGSAGQISVTFDSGDTAKATVVGRDSGYDLAVVKVSHVRGLKPMPLGNSDNVRVGDPVVAIGAPFDLEGTVTSGIISAKERPITAGGDSSGGSDVSYVDALQTDAPINPGNSGGPLLDSEARVIGINSAIRSADDGADSGGGQAGSIGLGFAIPVNQAKRVAEELINTGKAAHPVIGVTLDMDYTGDGARVGAKAQGGGPAVNAGGPGDKAGIKAGDVITAVDGRRVHSGEELIVRTRAHRPGDRLELTVLRDGKEKRISLVLGSSDGG